MSIPVGPIRNTHPNGTVEEVSNYTYGKKDGKSKLKRPDGSIELRNYTDG